MSEWISVKDRLPQNGIGNVAIYASMYGKLIGLFTIDPNTKEPYVATPIGRLTIGETVTHWLPLPEPPEN